MSEPRRGSSPFEVHFQCVVKLVDEVEQKFGKDALGKICHVCLGPENKLGSILRSGDIRQMRHSYRELYQRGPGAFSRLPIVLDYLLKNYGSLDELNTFLEKLGSPIVTTYLTSGGSRLTRIAEHIAYDSVPELIATVSAAKESADARELARVKESARQMERRAKERHQLTQLVDGICSAPDMITLFDLLPERDVYRIKLYMVGEDARKIVRRRSFYPILLELSKMLHELRVGDKHLPALIYEHGWESSKFSLYVTFKDFWNGRIGESKLKEAVREHGRLLDMNHNTAHVYCGGPISIYKERVFYAIKRSHMELTLLRVKLAIKLRNEFSKAMGIPNPVS